MRRPIASLLLLLFLAGLCLPVVQAQPQTPACCRRAGRHHCTAVATAPGSDAFRSQPACCLYRHPHALTTHGNSALGVTVASHLALVMSPAVVVTPDATSAQNGMTANLQRGPPLS